jgi:acetyl esterase
MTLDEANTAFLEAMAGTGRKPSWLSSPEEARAGGPRLAAMIGPGPQMLRVDDMRARAGNRDVAIRLLVPHDEPAGVLVYLHGGGWVLGSIDEFDTLGRRLAEASGWTVAMVDYSLAPEHPFPAGLDDAWAALELAARVAGGTIPLAVAGDSAGANLAAVLARWAAACDHLRLAAQILVYPVTDASMDTASYADPANQLLFRRESMQWFLHHYLPAGHDAGDPDVSPLRAEDLTGVAPALVVTAEHDVLRDEGEAYAERLRAVGALIDLVRVPGQMHGFFSMPNLLPASGDAIDLIADTLADTAEKERR